MVDMILDETLFADFQRGDEGARAVVEAILDGNVTAAVSPMTAYRIWQDAELDRRAEIMLLSLLRFVEEAPLSIDAAKTAGLWLAALPPEERDALGYYALVASTAVQIDAPVCTRKPAPFEQFGAQTTAY